jgi:putative spermidine/putrescine transport system permease protein
MNNKRVDITRILFYLYLVVIVGMLYFPFILMFVLSFQGPRGGHTFPMQGTSTWWYYKLFHPGELTPYSDVGEFLGDYLGALKLSAVLAVIVTFVSTSLALMATLAFRKNFRGSKGVFYVWLLGIIVPGIITSLGLSLLFKQLHISQAWYSTTFAVHVLYTLPFCLIILLMFFNRFDPSLEDAANVFGADSWKTFWHVTFPNISPAVMSAAMFAFTLSLDEYQRSLYVTGNVQTLPLMVMSSVTTRVTPTIYALGSVTTLLSFVLIIAYLAFFLRGNLKARAIVPEKYATTADPLEVASESA